MTPGSSDGKNVAESGSHSLTVRALLLGLAFAALLSWLANVGEIEFQIGQRILLTSGSLPLAASVVIVVLVGANLLLKKLHLARWMLGQAEIIYILGISTVTVLMGSDAALRQLPAALVTPFEYARAENEYGARFTDYLPEWFLPHELRQKVGRYDETLLGTATAGLLGAGPMPVVPPPVPKVKPEATAAGFLPQQSTRRRYMTDVDQPRYREFFATFFTGGGRVPWRVWVRPILVWVGFSLVFYTTLLCFISLAQRQWIDRERLAFPLLVAPLEVTRQDANTKLLLTRFFQIGFIVAFLYYAHLSIGALIPGFPALKLFVNLKTFMTNKPWSAVVLFLLAFDFVSFALFFIMPKDVTLSFWVFHLLSTFSYVFGSTMGWGSGNPQSPIAMTRWPFYGEVGYGAFAGVLVLAAWTGRRHIARVLRTAFGGHSDGVPDGERTTLWLTFWGLVAGIVALIAFAVFAGMKPSLSALFLGILFVYVLSMVRVRAESALPYLHGPNIWSGNPDAVFRMTVGTVKTDPTSLAVMGGLSWTSVMVMNSPVPHMMNAFKLAQASGASRRTMLKVLVLAVAFGLVLNCFLIIRAYYTGGASGHLGTGLALRVAQEVVDDSRRERPVDVPGLVAIGGAVAFAVLLGVLRARFLWWPFHPVGFALSHSFWCSMIWFSAAVAWMAKLLVLRYGGASLHRKMFLLCVGLIVGSWTWNIIWYVFMFLRAKGGDWGTVLYRFFS